MQNEFIGINNVWRVTRRVHSEGASFSTVSWWEMKWAQKSKSYKTTWKWQLFTATTLTLSPVTSTSPHLQRPGSLIIKHRTAKEPEAWSIDICVANSLVIKAFGRLMDTCVVSCVAFLSITLIMGVPSYVVAPHHVQSPTHPPLNFSSALQLVLYVREGYKCQNSMVN